MQFRKIVDDVHEHKIEERDVTAEQQHRDDHHEGRINQLLVSAESAFFRVPRPGSFLKLDLHFGEKVSDFAHLNSKKRRTSNAQRPTPNYLLLNSMFSVRRSTFGVCGLFSRQAGLEPPTGGFGDRYSTN